MRHRCPHTEKERAKQARLDARAQASEFVKGFREKFGALNCFDLIGIDFSQPDGYKKFLDSGIWKDRCIKYVQFAVEKLYEFDERGSDPGAS